MEHITQEFRVRALDDVCFHVKKDEFLLVGENGVAID
jgi:ABC-type oligopeptide transport system ATPase subunit